MDRSSTIMLPVSHEIMSINLLASVSISISSSVSFHWTWVTVSFQDKINSRSQL